MESWTEQGYKSRWLAYLRRMGPAWIVSAVACGPATIASVSAAGIGYGYQLLWVVVLSALLGTTAQYLAARLGVLTGEGIISTVEKNYGETWAWILTLNAVAVTWLASIVLMKALAGTTALLTRTPAWWWAAPFALLFAFLLVLGGYRWFEGICKALVVFVVACFIATVFIIRPPGPEVALGLVPSLPGGSALAMAGVLGGAVHITIIGMHTYTTNARGWTREHLDLARFDTIMSMFLAFGLYSAAIYLTAAAVLHPAGVDAGSAADVAASLGPLLGDNAHLIFLVGLWGAALSTLGPTFLASAYFIADKMNWETHVEDRRFASIVLAGCLLSIVGPFLGGSFLTALVVMLALGLAGTPLVLLFVLLLLNHESTGEPNPRGLNALGVITLLLTVFLAGRFLLTQLGLI